MSIPLTEIERINVLLPTELFAGSKDWRVGSIADRVDWLLIMYASAKEEVERLQPAQRKPLTDAQIETVWRSVQANDFHDCVKPFARAIEAAHNIKGDA